MKRKPRALRGRRTTTKPVSHAKSRITKPDGVTMSIRLPRDLHASLKHLSRKGDYRSMNSLLVEFARMGVHQAAGDDADEEGDENAAVEKPHERKRRISRFLA